MKPDFVLVGDDRHCNDCGSRAVDRIVQVFVSGAWRDEIKLQGARALLAGVSDCQASHVFGDVEQYRCDSDAGPSVDLIAELSRLSSVPEGCFDLIVVGASFALRSDLDQALVELHRVLMPGGHLIVPIGAAVADRKRTELVEELCEAFDVHADREVDRATGISVELHLCHKDMEPLGEQLRAPGELTGYAYHLSRKTGCRIVFCLDGPLSAGDRLPIKSVNDEVVGHVTIRSYEGARASPPEPWAEGFCLPPRATFELTPTLPSGVYTLAGKIPFVHRNANPTPIAVLLPSNTAAAFNDAGGRSLYRNGATNHQASALSFQRPIKAEALLAGCLSFVRWFAKAYGAQEVTYLLDSDLEQADALDDSVAVLIVVGRSEYWSRPMRKTFDRFVDRGGRALLVCSEIMYWQVRLDHSRYQLIRYGEGDPHPDPLLKTTVWHDPSLRYPVYPRTGCELRYGGERSTQEVGWNGMRIVCPESPLLEGLDLAKNDVIRLPDATVWDGAPVVSDNGKLIVDFGESVPWRHEVVGYNLVRSGGQRSQDVATSLWIAMRSSPESGTVVHCGTMGWCGTHAIGGRGPDSERIRTIVTKMIDILRQDVWPFSFRRDQSDDDGPSDGSADPFTAAST